MDTSGPSHPVQHRNCAALLVSRLGCGTGPRTHRKTPTAPLDAMLIGCQPSRVPVTRPSSVTGLGCSVVPAPEPPMQREPRMRLYDHCDLLLGVCLGSKVDELLLVHLLRPKISNHLNDTGEPTQRPPSQHDTKQHTNSLERFGFVEQVRDETYVAACQG